MLLLVTVMHVAVLEGRWCVGRGGVEGGRWGGGGGGGSWEDIVQISSRLSRISDRHSNQQSNDMCQI